MKKKLLLIIFLICIVVLGILVIILNKVKEQKLQKYEDPFTKFAQEEYKEEKIVPQNFTPLMREYGGEVETKEWYSHIYKFVDIYIPEIQKSKDILDYYNENYLRIKTDLGTDSYEKFEALANKVNGINISAEFKDSEFDATTINLEENSISVDFNILFTNNEELNLKFVVYNVIEDGIEVSILAE